MRSPYSHQELADMNASLKAQIEQTEQEHPEVRALPPMSEPEARELLMSWIATARHRQITEGEAFLMEQLLSAFGMACRAEVLGYKGRYYVISEDRLIELTSRDDQHDSS